MKKSTYLTAGLCGFVLLSGFAHAAEPKIKLLKEGSMREVLVDLTAEGVKLEAGHTVMFNSLRGEVRKGIAIKDFTLTPIN